MSSFFWFFPQGQFTLNLIRISITATCLYRLFTKWKHEINPIDFENLSSGVSGNVSSPKTQQTI